MDVEKHGSTRGFGWDVEIVVPFIVRRTEYNDKKFHAYYFWLFGYVVKLPYEVELEVKVRPEVENHFPAGPRRIIRDNPPPGSSPESQ